MRLYPIQIILKDVTLLFSFSIFSGMVGRPTPDNLFTMLVFSGRMMAGIMGFNFILQTILFMLRRDLERRMRNLFLVWRFIFPPSCFGLATG
jgi:hypothetical protein